MTLTKPKAARRTPAALENDDTNPKANPSRDEFQGHAGNARHGDQPAPQWDRPAGSDAADLLDSLLAPRDPAKPWAVVCRRFDGRERVWTRYVDRDEAERVAAHLTKIGCPSRCASDDDLPLERGAK